MCPVVLSASSLSRPLYISFLLFLSFNHEIPIGGSRKINSPLPLLSPSPSQRRVKRHDEGERRDVRRGTSTYVHCHYESAHNARSVSFLLRACTVQISLPASRVCVRIYLRMPTGATHRLYNRGQEEEKKKPGKMRRDDITAKDPLDSFSVPCRADLSPFYIYVLPSSIFCPQH